jgi:hypothetical protein
MYKNKMDQILTKVENIVSEMGLEIVVIEEVVENDNGGYEVARYQDVNYSDDSLKITIGLREGDTYQFKFTVECFVYRAICLKGFSP